MDSGILGSKKLGLLDRDPFRARHAEFPGYRRPSEEMPNIIFADDDSSERDVHVPRPVLLSALKTVPQPQRVSIASTPVNVATFPLERDISSTERGRAPRYVLIPWPKGHTQFTCFGTQIERASEIQKAAGRCWIASSGVCL